MWCWWESETSEKISISPHSAHKGSILPYWTIILLGQYLGKLPCQQPNIAPIYRIHTPILDHYIGPMWVPSKCSWACRRSSLRVDRRQGILVWLLQRKHFTLQTFGSWQFIATIPSLHNARNLRRNKLISIASVNRTQIATSYVGQESHNYYFNMGIFSYRLTPYMCHTSGDTVR